MKRGQKRARTKQIPDFRKARNTALFNPNRTVNPQGDTGLTHQQLMRAAYQQRGLNGRALRLLRRIVRRERIAYTAVNRVLLNLLKSMHLIIQGLSQSLELWIATSSGQMLAAKSLAKGMA